MCNTDLTLVINALRIIYLLSCANELYFYEIRGNQHFKGSDVD